MSEGERRGGWFLGQSGATQKTFSWWVCAECGGGGEGGPLELNNHMAKCAAREPATSDELDAENRKEREVKEGE